MPGHHPSTTTPSSAFIHSFVSQPSTVGAHPLLLCCETGAGVRERGPTHTQTRNRRSGRPLLLSCLSLTTTPLPFAHHSAGCVCCGTFPPECSPLPFLLSLLATDPGADVCEMKYPSGMMTRSIDRLADSLMANVLACCPCLHRLGRGVQCVFEITGFVAVPMLLAPVDQRSMIELNPPTHPSKCSRLLYCLSGQ